jgi:O-antigen/teichoic acid export membrane protein
MLLVTPIFISKLGIEQYGLWMLINSLILSMSILNIGGVDTVIKYISQYRATNDIKSINEIFSTVFVTQLMFAFIIVIVSFFLPAYILKYSIFNISINLEIIFEIALQFGILLFSLKLIEQVILAYFKGFERFDISAKLSIFSKFMMIVIQLLTIYYIPTLDKVFENSFIYLFILLVGEILFIKYQNKKINFIKDYKVKRIYEIFHFTKWSWIISIVATASSQVDRLIVATMANMVTLGYYSVALLVFNSIHSIIASSMTWIFPKVSKEANEENIYNYYLLLQAILFLGSFLISYILITFDNIFLFWLKEDSFNHSIEYIRNLLVLIPLYSMGIIPFLTQIV